MFLKNAWYCAGWNHEFHQGAGAVIARKIAGERLVLYRTRTGHVVAFQDRCPHRQAALSLGRKEGDSLRCMYHGLKFNSEGICEEIPGQDNIPTDCRVRTYPVIEKNSWVWVWMGDPAQADPGLICFSVGPENPNWNMKISKMHVETNYLWEIENLADLSHIAWVHNDTVGGDLAFSRIKPKHTTTARGTHTSFWVYSHRPLGAIRHLFPEDARIDSNWEIDQTVPCNWNMRVRFFTPGTETEGPSNGELMADTWTCQSVTPCDDDSVDYYYSWGADNASEARMPGLSDLLGGTLDIAFNEDKVMLEAQHLRRKEMPDFKMTRILHDAGPSMILRVLNTLIKKENEIRPVLEPA
ncbi:MAG: aromatic ring-hydroxylating dioxygenase subunit alpha [Nevskiaceae bacterium]|nr:MAG: aromatic ring-hydroxylating dioxygenase subunit alpha [Nevskiaceae bacterium]TBR72102.1 MAG: aromatic ring-hydroxylating dioxygenase subunit alpha [Nevskiaceae bacterium]